VSETQQGSPSNAVPMTSCAAVAPDLACAPERAGQSPPMYDAPGVFTMAAAHALHDTFQGFLPPLLPEFIASMSLSRAEAGGLALLLDMPSLLQPLIGQWADRIDMRSVVVCTPAVTAITMSLLGIAPSYGTLAVLLIIAGVSRAAFHAVGPVAAGQLSGARLGQGMGFWMVGGHLGPALSPLVVVAVLSYLGLRKLPVVMVFGLLGSLFLWRRVALLPSRARDEGSRTLSWQPVAAMAPFILLVAVIVSLRSFMTSSLHIFLPVYLSEKGVSLWFSGAILAVLQGSGILGGLVAGVLSDHIGRRETAVIAFLTAPGLMWLFLRTSGWAQLPVTALLGFSALSTMSVFMALMQESFPENRALANGVYLAMTFVLQSVIGVIVGWLGDRFGLAFAFGLSGAAFLLCAPLALLLPGRLASSS